MHGDGCGAIAYVGSRAGEIDGAGHVRATGRGDAEPHEADGLLLGAAVGPGDACDADPDVGVKAGPGASREGLGDLGGDRAMALDLLGGDARIGDLDIV